jgi:hypothetical protein
LADPEAGNLGFPGDPSLGHDGQDETHENGALGDRLQPVSWV